MSVLDKYFTIFEGADDAKHRQWARDVFESVRMAALSGKIKLEKVNKDDPRSSVIFSYMKSIPASHQVEGADALVFIFSPTTKEKTGVAAQLIKLSDVVFGLEVFLNLRKGGDLLNDLSNPRVLNLILTGRKDSIVHELIHFRDFKRIPLDRAKKTFSATSSVIRRKGEKGYYNDPLELNAYIQQGLSALEDHLRHNPDDAKKILGGSANDMYNELMKIIHDRFDANLIGKNRNKLKKRVYQFWKDMTSKGGETK